MRRAKRFPLVRGGVGVCMCECVMLEYKKYSLTKILQIMKL